MVKEGSVNITVYVSHNNAGTTARTAQIVKDGTSVKDTVTLGGDSVKPPYVVTIGLSDRARALTRLMRITPSICI